MSGFDPSKKNPPAIVQVDHETGMLHVPGIGDLPLVGPTSGSEYKRLKESEIDKREMNKRLMAVMRKSWQCVQCRRVWKIQFEEVCVCGHPQRFHQASVERPCVCPKCKGFESNGELPVPGQRAIRVVWRRPEGGGPETEVLVCADPRCNGPVVALTGSGQISG